MNSNSFIILEFAGKKFPCKFGMNAFYIFTQLRDIKLSDIQKVTTDANDFTSTRDLIWCGIEAACQSQNIENPMNIFQVGDMLDEADTETMKKISEAIKNSQVFGRSLEQSDEKKSE